jgi:hypothetical protein
MRVRIALSALAFASLASFAAPAQVRLGVGGDYIFDNQGAFELTLAVEGRLAHRIAVEGRFGGLITTSNPTLGVPLDFGLRVTPGGRTYFEVLVGPWFFFNGGDAVRGHGEFGFGLERRSFSFGLAVGGLTGSNAMIGARLGWRL